MGYLHAAEKVECPPHFYRNAIAASSPGLPLGGGNEGTAFLRSPLLTAMLGIILILSRARVSTGNALNRPWCRWPVPEIWECAYQRWLWVTVSQR